MESVSKVTDYCAPCEAFSDLCEEMSASDLVGIEECQYWVFERGYQAAVAGLLHIMKTGTQAKKFTSPELQALAEKLMS
jgi:hypothetical protein